jgi:hypothetical protein
MLGYYKRLFKGAIMAGYHINKIPKGTIGEFSKVVEEFLEFEDSMEQSSSVMALVELSDLVGAVGEFFSKNGKPFLLNELVTKVKNNPTSRLVDYADLKECFAVLNHSVKLNDYSKFEMFFEELDAYVKQYNLNINDLYVMAQITRRVFVNGYRQSSN